MGGILGKSGSFVLDHSLDNIPLSRMDDPDLRHGSITTLSMKGFPPDEDDALLSLYETKAEKKTRRRSLGVSYVTMFVMSVGFSIVLTGVWPYMQTLNGSLGKESVGLVVAANPLGQVLASPLLGLWGNKLGSIRIPCLVTVTAFILGNAMYALLPALNNSGEMASYYGMIVSRFIVGVSSACVVLTRSYVASATTLKERTVAISIVAGAQALGFVVGPAIQAMLTAIIPEEVETGIWWLRWNQYTACSWVAAAMGLINLIILMPCVFKEHNIAAKEIALMKSEDENVKLPKPDIIGVIGIMFSNFLSQFIFTLIETLAEPLVQDEYGWSDNLSVIITGVTLAVGGLWCVGMFSLSGYLCRKYDERKVLLMLGFPLVILGAFLCIPFAGGAIPRKCQNETTTTILPCTTPLLPSTSFSPSATSITSSPSTISLTSSSLSPPNLPNEITVSTSVPSISSTVVTTLSSTGSSTITPEDCTEYGCPYEDQPWCEYTPQTPLPQLGIAFFIVMSGYPVTNTITQAIYSKMLGPKPQGLWMGLLTTAGGLSRILGPIFVTYVYTYYGTYVTFGVLTGAMVLAMTELLFNYKRLVPMKVPSVTRANGYDGPAAKDKF